MAVKKQPKIYSVSQVTSMVRVAIEDNLPGRLIVTGQISSWRPHFSGHSYFSIKDEGSILPCVMWKSKLAKLKFDPEDGMEVLLTGNIDIYAPSGKYQFYVDKIEPAGVGQLQIAFEQMVKKLHAKGLFEEEHKKPIPKYPMRIGIVTSASGAAVKDIQDSIHSRWPCAKLLLCPAKVQGDGSAKSIASAIKYLNAKNKSLNLDVLIVGRGGGSIEDLWAFNEEPVAKAIFASKIPVISAVGHEIDTTIADLVADARASTPTKAGVIAVPDINEELARLDAMSQAITARLREQINLSAQQLATQTASYVFRNPERIVNDAQQRVDELSLRLSANAKDIFAQCREKLDALGKKVASIEPHRLLADRKEGLSQYQYRLKNALSTPLASAARQLDDMAGRLRASGQKTLSNSRLSLAVPENRLKGLNPKSVLDRGYSITTIKQTSKVLAGAEDVSDGDMIITELKGQIFVESQVKKE